jgi:hypothetical protein
MIPMLMIAATLAGLTPGERRAAECTVAAAVDLGRDNREPVDVVIRAAEARCHDQWSSLRELWAWKRSIGAHYGPDAAELQINDYVFERAFEAIMNARAERQCGRNGTVDMDPNPASPPPHCG